MVRGGGVRDAGAPREVAQAEGAEPARLDHLDGGGEHRFAQLSVVVRHAAKPNPHLAIDKMGTPRQSRH
ncbi:hypothetical protein Aru02nite_47950 [Actinocatenispora rupis]|uniref:Uncharacterized protein n=1 Tax=Actinocatenispora rupis TaxID=519421 RepID=A0A8J3J8Z6_9ACTN|nr:hypothetical protein Aru02nite_47950 [Actinocatenispora rupis]